MYTHLQTKSQMAIRYTMVHGLLPISPLYIVNEYPKSGGTWIGQMLSCALGLPFPRNCFPTLEPSIMHGHYLNSWGMKRVLVIWRDGRDLMVSWYHHCLFLNESRRNSKIVNTLRSQLQFADYADVQTNLPIFIDHCFTRCWPMKYSWNSFVQKWLGHQEITYTRYEDLRRDGVRELQRIVEELAGQPLSRQKAFEIVETFSFVRQAGRKPGDEKKNNFLRKGIVGDWKNQFTQEACELFDHYAGDSLIQLGYEYDRSWVKKHEISNAS